MWVNAELMSFFIFFCLRALNDFFNVIFFNQSFVHALLFSLSFLVKYSVCLAENEVRTAFITLYDSLQSPDNSCLKDKEFKSQTIIRNKTSAKCA